MRIDIVTTPNEKLKETGFGTRYANYCVLQSLLQSQHHATVTVCTNAADLNAVIARNPDIIISAVKYLLLENEQKLWLSEYFEDAGVNYAGSTRETLSYDSDKISAKEQVASKGINTAAFFLTQPNEHKSEKMLPLPFPLFIKPTNAANGNGVGSDSVVHNFTQFQTKTQTLHNEYGEPLLVEEYLEGREFTVAIIKAQSDLIIAPIEIIPPEEEGIRVLGAKVKTDNSEILQVITEKKTLAAVIKIAEQSFHALNVRDFGRIDIKMDHDGKCYFMEANLVPGMKRGSSYFPQSFEMVEGLDYNAVVSRMIEGAAERLESTIPSVVNQSPIMYQSAAISSRSSNARY